jgi:flagellum-specific peptidoglycan hydrolase FlgJ
MFKLQTKEYSNGKRWQDMKLFRANRFATVEEATDYARLFDEDGTSTVTTSEW